MNEENYFKYYIQGSDHYLIPRDIFNEIFEDYKCFKNDCKKYKEVIDKAIKNLENAGKIEKLENQKKEFIDYLGNEKDRLVRECSQIYEDSLGKTRLVNEDIFNEVDTIL